METKYNILIADDDADIAKLVAELLMAQDFDAYPTYSGTEALAAFEANDFDLVILDIMMPDIDGFDVCRKIRQTSDVPIMFLSARMEEADQVIAFSLDADDYITKPFRPRELVARVRARLRHSGKGAAPVPENSLCAHGIVIDLDAHTATVFDEPLKLTPKEFSLLSLLVENAGTPLSMRDMYQRVWGEDFDDAASNCVMVHIRHLRKKLADIDPGTEFITTIWGIGYKIDADPW